MTSQYSTQPETEPTFEAFLWRFWSDYDGAGLAPVDEYVQLFPSIEGVVRAEYAACTSVPKPGDPTLSHEDGSIQHDRSSPEWIGDHRILGILGRGGQGTVYLALDRKMKRRVAIKVLDGVRRGRDGFRARFDREAAILARLEHPGICAVYSTGMHGDEPYIVMRYVEGPTLAALIEGRRGEAPVTRNEATSGSGPRRPGDDLASAVRLVEDIARAVAAAHDAHVVHRDLKPGNIIVPPTGSPMILDFGLARDDDQPAGATETGAVFGTPPYMAPEQHRGVRVDERADVWALGTILYETLTLETLFRRATAEGIRRAIEEAPIPSLRRLCPAAPKSLDDVLRVALERNPDRRYQTARDFADDLARVLRREPIVARPPGPLVRCAAWASRNRALAASLLTTFGVLVTALVVTMGNLDTQARLLREKDEEGRLREIAHLTLQARQSATSNPREALALAARASKLGQTPELRSVSAQALRGLRETRRISDCSVLDLQPGHILVRSPTSREVSVLSAADGQRLASFIPPGDSVVGAGELAPDGSRAWLRIDQPGRFEVWLWPLKPGGKPFPLEGERPRLARFHPKGLFLFCVDGLFLLDDEGKTIRSWATPRELNLLPSPYISAAGDRVAGLVFLGDQSLLHWRLGDDALEPLPGPSVTAFKVLDVNPHLTRWLLSEPDTHTLVIAELGPNDQWAERPLDGLEGGVNCACWDTDEKAFLTGSPDGIVRRWAREGRLVRSFPAFAGPVVTLETGSDGSFMAGDGSGKVKVWRSGAAPASLSGHHGVATALMITDSVCVTAARADGTIRWWEPFRTDYNLQPPPSVAWRLHPAFSPIHAPAAFHDLPTWRNLTEEIHRSTDPYTPRRRFSADHRSFSPDGQRMAFGGDNGLCVVHPDGETSTPLERGFCRFAWLDSQRLFVMCREITVHDVVTRTSFSAKASENDLHADTGRGEGAYELTTSPRGDQVALAWGRTGNVSIVDAATLTSVANLSTGQDPPIDTLAFHADGKGVYAGDRKGNLWSWRQAGDTWIGPTAWPSCEGAVTCLDAGDRFLAAASSDGSVLILEVPSGEVWMKIEPPFATVSVSLDETGGFLWTWQGDGTVGRWPLDPVALLPDPRNEDDHGTDPSGRRPQ